jgi:hypothetical protein
VQAQGVQPQFHSHVILAGSYSTVDCCRHTPPMEHICQVLTPFHFAKFYAVIHASGTLTCLEANLEALNAAMMNGEGGY